MTNFNDTLIPEFLKDKKKLKIPTIDEDLIRFEIAFSTEKKSVDPKRITRLERKGVKIPVFKARKFRCKYLAKGTKSGIRIIFAFIPEIDYAIYIEIYKKNKQSNHDEKRIIRHFRDFSTSEFIRNALE